MDVNGIYAFAVFVSFSPAHSEVQRKLCDQTPVVKHLLPLQNSKQTT